MAHKIPEYKSANYVRDKTAVDILWRQLATLQEIAEEDDETFGDACDLFAKLIKQYMKYGLYVDGEVYGATE